MSQWFAGIFCPRKGRDAEEQESEMREETVRRVEEDLDGFGMRSQYWVITNSNYVGMEMSRKFKEAGSIPARYITMDGVRQPSILKDIQSPQYEQLISLYLNGNLIKSIECLQFFHAPKLTNLDLKNNLITSIRALRKCSFTLIHLCLNNNPILEFQGLSAVKFHKRAHNSITSSMLLGWGTYPLVFYDISQLARTESPKIMEMMFLRRESVPWREAAFQMLESRRFQKFKILEENNW